MKCIQTDEFTCIKWDFFFFKFLYRSESYAKFKQSKCCQHCNRSTLVNYNGLKSQIKWQLSEIPYLIIIKELCKDKRQILDSPILKSFADNNLKFDVMAENSPQWIENTVGKGEIALYDQLLLSQYFQKT